MKIIAHMEITDGYVELTYTKDGVVQLHLTLSEEVGSRLMSMVRNPEALFAGMANSFVSGVHVGAEARATEDADEEGGQEDDLPPLPEADPRAWYAIHCGDEALVVTCTDDQMVGDVISAVERISKTESDVRDVATLREKLVRGLGNRFAEGSAFPVVDRKLVVLLPPIK